jgi:hypothetical protein
MIETSKHPLFKAAFLKIYCIQITVRNLWMCILTNHFWYLLPWCYTVIWCINIFLLLVCWNVKACWCTQQFAGIFCNSKNYAQRNVTFSALCLKCFYNFLRLPDLFNDRAIGVRSPAGAKDFSSNLCVQTGSGAHPASCTGGPFPGGKSAARSWRWPLTPI